jgi:phosphoesterase RecJ-like protein
MISTLPLEPRLVRLIEDGSRFAVLTHINADGDGLGSSMGLWAFLRSRGKQARMINTDPVPANYRFLKLSAHVELFGSPDDGAFVEGADGVFVLDNGSLSRLGSLEPHVRNARGVKVCIDHHETRDDAWDLAVIDTEASASGEIVHRILEGMGAELTLEIAEALYVSLITDTGHFRFSKTRPLTHRLAALLLERGVSPERIYQEVYERHAEGYLRLMGFALATMGRDGGVAWTVLDRPLLTRLGAADEDTGTIVNALLSLEGVRMAILLKELAEGEVKVSLRSKGKVDVTRIAVRHGGGGHRNAAGIVLPGPIDAAARLLVDEGQAYLAGLP